MTITRLDLRVAAAQSADAKLPAACWLWRLFLKRRSQAEAARIMESTVKRRARLIRCGGEGLAGLLDRPHGAGPSAKLTDGEKARLAGWCGKVRICKTMVWSTGGSAT